MDSLTTTIVERGDLAHLALFLWASGSSALLVWALREMARVTAISKNYNWNWRILFTITISHLVTE